MLTSEFAKRIRRVYAYFYRKQQTTVSPGAQSVATAGDAGLQTNVLIPDSNHQSVQTNITHVMAQTNIVSEASIDTVSPPVDDGV